MPDGWTTLGKLRAGALFETRDGIRAVKTEYHTFINSAGVQCNCYLLASGEAAHFPRGDKEAVREIDLPFLLMLAQDKLAESDAYTRGLRDGAEQMRARAARALADGIRHPETLGGKPMVMTPLPMLAACIRALPLEG